MTQNDKAADVVDLHVIFNGLPLKAKPSFHSIVVPAHQVQVAFEFLQNLLDNAKYGNKTILPELRVIDSGIFRGFVIVNPRWSGFKEPEYYQAAKSVYLADNPDAELPDSELTEVEIESSPGDFDLRGFEIARSEFFDFAKRPVVTFENKKMKFSAECVHRFGERNSIEILINPITRKIAIRPTEKTNRNAVVFSTLSNKVYHPRLIPTAAWPPPETRCRIRRCGILLRRFRHSCSSADRAGGLHA